MIIWSSTVKVIWISFNSAGESILMHRAPLMADPPRLENFFTPANAASMPDNFHWAPYWGQPKVSNLPSGVSLSPNPHSEKTADDYSITG